MDGIVDCLATDHAPHHADEKAMEFDIAPFGDGGPGDGHPRHLQPAGGQAQAAAAAVRALWSTDPARLFKLPGGTLKVGSAADITLLDHEARAAVNPEKLPLDVAQHAVRRAASQGVAGCYDRRREGRLAGVNDDRPRRVVVVDDSPLQCAVLAADAGEALRRPGSAVETYADPVVACRRAAAGHPPHAAGLGDAGDGRRGRAGGARARGVNLKRIIITSSHPADELHRVFDTTGCLAVIEKAEPEQQAAFMMILDSIMRR